MKFELLIPMAVYVLSMWAYTVKMFLVRVRAIRSGEVKASYYKAHLGQAPSESVILVGRHYDNQFQVPLLFFVTCLVSMSMGVVSGVTVVLAWLFVVSRWLHSAVLLGKNSVMTRVRFFALGWLLILAMWIQILYAAWSVGSGSLN